MARFLPLSSPFRDLPAPCETGVFSKFCENHANTERTITIPVSEFTRNFGCYRMLAQRETVAVSSHGRITCYFIAPEEYEAFQRFKAQRSSFASADLSDTEAAAIGTSRMDPRHDHLNALPDVESMSYQNSDIMLFSVVYLSTIRRYA
jgi:hypothetical protein